MATAKTPNYTPEQTTELKAAYLAAVESGADEAGRKAVVQTFADKLGRSAASIVAKLVREGVYVAKEYKTKAGEKPVKKDAHAEAIGKVLKLSEPDVDSLAKANKKPLEAIFRALANSVPVEVDTPEVSATKAENLKAIRAVITMDEDEAGSLMRVKASILEKLAVFLSAED